MVDSSATPAGAKTNQPATTPATAWRPGFDQAVKIGICKRRDNFSLIGSMPITSAIIQEPAFSGFAPAAARPGKRSGRNGRSRLSVANRAATAAYASILDEPWAASLACSHLARNARITPNMMMAEASRNTSDNDSARIIKASTTPDTGCINWNRPTRAMPPVPSA